MHVAPPQVEVIVRRCLEKRPEDRYQTPADLVTALQAAQATTSAQAPGTPDGAAVARITSEPLPGAVAPAAPSPTVRSGKKGGRTLASDGTAELVATTSARRSTRTTGRRAVLISAGAVVVLAVAALIVVPGRGDDGEEVGQIGGATVAAGGSEWLRAGSAETDAGGSWRFKQSVPRDLIADGFIRTRLVAGVCTAAPEEAVAFEGTVPTDQLGHDLWEVILYPAGRATADPKFETSGAAFLRHQTNGWTMVEIALDRLPPRLTLNVCFRQE
jgi:hypothetical protein